MAEISNICLFHFYRTAVHKVTVESSSNYPKYKVYTHRNTNKCFYEKMISRISEKEVTLSNMLAFWICRCLS